MLHSNKITEVNWWTCTELKCKLSSTAQCWRL